MRAYIVIGLVAGGVGVLIGASAGFAYGIGITMLIAGMLEIFHWWVSS